MKWKKISFWLIFIFILGSLLNFGINDWIKNSLPNFISKRNDTPYNFNYADVSYSLFERQMIISNINISPKSKKKGIYTINVNKITIHGVKFLRFIIFKDLAANLIEIDYPNILIKQNIDSFNHKNDSVKYNLGNSIQIEKFVINKGNLALYNTSDGIKKASLTNLNLSLSGVLWDIANKEKRIPITYNKIKLEVSDVFYQLNEIHHLQLKKLKFEDGYIQTDQIILHPDITEEQFKNEKYYQKSLLNINIPTAKIKNLDWGYDKDDFFFLKTSKIEVDSTSIVIKEKSLNKPTKNITAHIDRIIPFNLNIDTIQILNSKLNFNNHITSNNINIIIQKIVNKINDKITLESLKLYNNSLIIYQQNNTEYTHNNRNNFTYLFDDILEIKNFTIANTHIQYVNENKKPILEMGNMNYSINDININTIFTNTKKYIPFSYSDYKLEADDIVYSGIKYHTFKIGKMLLKDNEFLASKIHIIPTITTPVFSGSNDSKDLFKIYVDYLKIPIVNWNITDNKFNLQAPFIVINEMNASIYRNPSVKLNSKKIHLNNYDLNTDIHIDKFSINKSSLNQYNAANGELITSIKDLKLQLYTITLEDSSNENPLDLPFSFSKFNLTGKNIFHDMGNHTIHTNYLMLTNSSLYATHIKIKPKKEQLDLMKKRGIDAYTINIPKVNIPKLNFKLTNHNIEFAAPLVSFEKMDVTIHQFDLPKKLYIPTYKSFLSEKLRKLKFKLNLKEVNFLNSSLTYEEESLNKKTGKIFFTDINAKVKNIIGGYKFSYLPDVTINFKSKFMNSGKLTAIWKFNTLNKNDNFIVKGSIVGLAAEQIDNFIKPYLNISFKGYIKKVSFNYYGDNTYGYGSFGMDYKNLKIAFYKKNGKKEKKMMSSLANLAIKKNSKDSLKISEIKKVERAKDKSFFNFIWKLTLKGLKETLSIF
ncbi:hypothetical protein [uncultured Apibacter sp.]|uniref:hypothetical protein n=1 Tax=uncultured Apibacter sp. TaxID=1778616 RepID=UPI0025CD18EE|nr:hypothetical protein [uncultured Apibacter sp.]